ncbi:Gfo/Idh/MocA family protein [Nocardioides dongkuii]|uniref:Gfo/Idh/MocA family protein n=1 Tax=Nocardioides dongkuii TaxID=2760089 RepID=UPI0029D40FBB|nr:Gfo/Idh/MocA family oxidoreductase [Nocardioides dongkuii]
MSASPARPLGVAVVGYSFMGKAHSHAWRNVGAFFPDVPRVRQQVLVGRDERAVEDAAERYGWAESATDWTEVLDRDDVDVVDICTPGETHAEIALAALAAGKHVLVEKPLANTVAEAEAMVAAAADAAGRGVRSMIGFNYRRVPALALARALIADGRIGTVRQVRAAYLQDWLADAAAPMTWRLRRESAGSGVLGDLGSHVVDQLHHLLGDRVTGARGHLRTFVTERTGPDGPEPVTVDDAAWATLELASGAVASLEVSRMATGRKNGLALEVYGDRGSLAFDLERLNELQVDGCRVLVTETDHPYLDAWWPPGHVLGWDSTFLAQAADFLAAVGAGTDPSPSFADGLAVQRVLAAIEDSAGRSGARVDVDTEEH